jgi:integrase
MKLTKRTIDALQPREQEFTAWDGELRGFGCRVHPSGRRMFILKYRVGGGRSAAQRKMQLGAYGPVTADEARKRAHKALLEVAGGGDPAGARAEHRRAATVNELAQRYMAEHAGTRKALKSVREDRRLIDLHILPKIGTRKVIDLTTADVSKVIHAAAHRPSRRRKDLGQLRATPVLANRVRALLSKMLALSVVWGLRKDPINPVQLVEKFPEKSRERFLSANELDKLGKTLAELERTQAEPWQAIAAIRLLIFTGCRKSEILSLRWDYIDRQQGVIMLPETKTGRQTKYLFAPVLSVLDGLPRKEACPYVLPSRLANANRHFDGLGHVWERVRSKAGLHRVRLHDLRHTYASKGVGLHMGLPIVGALLGHALPTTTAKYAHLEADPVRKAGERIANLLAVELSASSNANPGADVLQLNNVAAVRRPAATSR